MNIAEFVQSAYQQRVERFAKCVAAARERPEVEAVHQVRTSWRRLEALVRLFPWLADKTEWAKFRRKAKGVMAASGELRDRDNAIAHFSGSALLEAALQAQRHLWEPIFLARLEQLPAPPAVLKQSKRGQAPVESAAAKLLQQARAGLAKRSRILQRNTNLKKWHEFRIHAKRQRYIFELFQTLPLPGLVEDHAALKELQDQLGAIQDCSAMATVARKAAGGRLPIVSELNQLCERQQLLAQNPPQWPRVTSMLV